MLTLDHGASVDERADVDNVVEVLNLDDGDNPHTYVREGKAEVLRLEQEDEQEAPEQVKESPTFPA